MFALIASYLLLVFLLPLALSAVIGYRSLPRGRTCPQCGAETLPLLNRSLTLLNALNRSVTIQSRWCFGCGWEGLQRVSRPPAPGRTAVPRTPVDSTVSPSAAAPGTLMQTLNVRLLDVDGSAWRVMLQCWTSTGLVYGRLVFVSPTGRLWLDAVEAFTCVTEDDALVQIRSLPDPLLTRRLRRLALRREA